MSLEGRWTLLPAGHFRAVVLNGPRVAEDVPVVPCDDAAVERAAMEVAEGGEPQWWDFSEPTRKYFRQRAEAILRAAGETP